jgi:hypothetical protein
MRLGTWNVRIILKWILKKLGPAVNSYKHGKELSGFTKGG